MIQESFHCFLVTLSILNDPLSFRQAVTTTKWVNAMNKELEAIELNEIWVITTLPPGENTIGIKLLYKTKFGNS